MARPGKPSMTDLELYDALCDLWTDINAVAIRVSHLRTEAGKRAARERAARDDPPLTK